MTASVATALKPTRKPAAKKAPAVKSATLTKPAAKPAKKAPAKRAPKAVVKMSTDDITLLTDPAAIRKQIKITRDRRWRAGRRDDAELVARMSEQLTRLTSALALLDK